MSNTKDRRQQEARPRAKSLKARPETRGRQVIRQLTLLRALENARRGLTVSELHEIVCDGCVSRMTYRDIEQLQTAGFPLEKEGGRWRLREPSRLKAQPLQPSEVFALLLAEELLSPVNAGVVGKSLRDLRQRLTASLTEVGREMLVELREQCVATLAAPPANADGSDIFDAIDDAVGREHCLQITYEAPGKVATQRSVEPHLFWVHAGRPYLVAYCRARREFRTFAVQRITSAEVLDEPFERRADFDPERFTQNGFGVLHGEVHPVQVQFSKDVAHLATERRWHPSQEVQLTTDGGALLSMEVSGLEEVAAWIASFGGMLRAVAPEKLVTAVRALHERGLAAHRSDVQGKGNGRTGRAAAKRRPGTTAARPAE